MPSVALRLAAVALRLAARAAAPAARAATREFRRRAWAPALAVAAWGAAVGAFGVGGVPVLPVAALAVGVVGLVVSARGIFFAATARQLARLAAALRPAMLPPWRRLAALAPASFFSVVFPPRGRPPRQFLLRKFRNANGI